MFGIKSVCHFLPSLFRVGSAAASPISLGQTPRLSTPLLGMRIFVSPFANFQLRARWPECDTDVAYPRYRRASCSAFRRSPHRRAAHVKSRGAAPPKSWSRRGRQFSLRPLALTASSASRTPEVIRSFCSTGRTFLGLYSLIERELTMRLGVQEFAFMQIRNIWTAIVLAVHFFRCTPMSCRAYASSSTRRCGAAPAWPALLDRGWCR